MIIGVTGTIGAGKGVLVEYLKKRGFAHYSAREFIKKEIQKRELISDRDSMTIVANDLRKQHGATYIIESLFKEATAHGGDAVIESVRELDGADFLKEQGAIIIAVDADRPLRFERIHARGLETDNVTFEKFVEQEDRELYSHGPNTQNILAVIENADYQLLNNGSVEEFEEEIDTMLSLLKK